MSNASTTRVCEAENETSTVDSSNASFVFERELASERGQTDREVDNSPTTQEMLERARVDATTLSALANAMKKRDWDAYAATLPPESGAAVECAIKSARATWHRDAVAALTSTQRKAYDAVVCDGESIFVTGPAGNGKTHLLRAMVEGLEMKGDVRVKVTATTASAALNLELSASTLHSFARLGLGDKPASEYLRNWKTGERVRKAWNEVDVLFVDEVSMLEPKYFELLGEIARAARKSSRGRKRDASRREVEPNVPETSESVASNAFGGLQLVLTGDFYQLPPVTKGYRDPNRTKYVFQTDLWHATVSRTFVLREPQRQREDPEFAQLLDRVRVGRLTEPDRRFLRSRVSAAGTPLPENATRIRALRADVQAINAAALAKLPGDPTAFVARHGFAVPPTKQESWHEERLKKIVEAAPTDERLLLKIGSRVLLVANLNPASGLVKGARGAVVDFRLGCSVATGCSNTKLHKHRRATGNKRHLEPELCPVVRFETGAGISNGGELLVPRWVWESEIPDVGDAYVEQFPLLGADAITCHRAQGMTLPCVEVGMEKIFDAGQAYVALGRVPKSEGLHLTCFAESVVRADQDVFKFYASIEASL